MSVGDLVVRDAQIVQRDSGPLERRDPSAATIQTSFMGSGAPMVAEWDAAQAIRFGYLANVIAYRCVQIYAEIISALPILWGPDPDNRTLIAPTCRGAQLLGSRGRPAPKLSTRKLVAWTVAQRIVTGRHAWEIECSEPGGQGEPVAFWPLVSPMLEATPTDGGTDWFRLFKYGRPDQRRTLLPGQVWYGWNPSQHDFRQPESALNASRYDLSAAIMGDRYSVAFFRNGAVPAAVVVAPQPPDPEARDRFERRWASEYQGPDNANRTRFEYVDDPGSGNIADLIAIKQLGVTQKDAQFVLEHRMHLEMIAISLGVPWSKLDAAGRTYDNAGHEDLTFWEGPVLEKITTFQDEFNAEVAPRLGSEVMWFDLSQVRALQRPKSFTIADGVAMAQLGHLIKRDELRAAADLPPLGPGQGGDDLIEAPGGVMAPPSDASATADPTVGTTGDGTGRQGELAGPLEHRDHVVEPLSTHEPPPVAQIRPAVVPAHVRRERVWKAHDATASSLESRWASAMRRLFERQARSVRQALGGKRGAKLATRAAEPAPSIDPAQVFNPDYWREHTAEVVRDLYEAVTAQGLAKISDHFGVGFDVASPFAQDFIMARANKLAGQVNDTTYAAIQAVLRDGVAQGWDLGKISDGISHVFEVASDSRAMTIARTEVVSAYNGSASLGAAQLPPDVVAGQEWVATQDARTRDDHAAADGQVVAIGDSFDVGGEQLAYPGDPNGSADEIVNCRCTVAFLTPDEAGHSDSADRSAPRMVTRSAAVVALRYVGDTVDELGLRRALREAS